MSNNLIPVFDIGDTISPSRQYSKKFFREELISQGIDDPPEYPFEGYNEYVTGSIQRWLDEDGIDADAERIVKSYRRAKKEKLKEIGVFETLRQVQQNIATPGFLSDNRVKAKKFYLEVLEEEGVEIDGFVVSEEIGVRKPDKQIFQEFLDRRGVEAERCVYFGNRGDIDAACEIVGMKFVWVTRFDTFGTDWDGIRINEFNFENVQKALKEVKNREHNN